MGKSAEKQSGRNLLSVRELKKYFPVKGGWFSGKKQFLRANDDVSFDIKEGETFALVGESGCGKSTLGRTVLGLYRPTSGRVLYYPKEGEPVDLASLSDRRLREYRKDLQIIFQDPYSSLNPRMTVGRLIEEGAATHKYYPRGSAQMREYVLRLMDACGLQPHMLQRYPHEFSGGQRQRVCIARALAVKPRFIVCDECVSALDVSIQSQILNLLTDLKEREKLTYLFISHDLSVVRHISDRVAVMYLGKIIEMGTVEEIFKNPRHPYTIALQSCAPTVGGKARAGRRIVPQGHMPSPVNPPSGCPFAPRCFMAQECCKRIPAPVVEVEKGHTAACHFADVPTALKKRRARERERVE